ncbi:hypothetical protein Tco_1042933 [Tanacetum coccineum]|uniref:Uncharacterized protein n=1 Tax=Tanacetum coccineum TaxID=301880 RepID=A0ABQ5GN62_9ASTR
MLHQIFVTEDVVVDGMHRNLNPPRGLIRIHKLIDLDSEYAKKVEDELMWLIESRPDVVTVRETVEKN